MDQNSAQNLSPLEVRNTIDWLIKTEEYNQAKALAFTLSRFLPQEHPETSDFLAMVLHRTKNYAEAMTWAEETARLVPESLEARYNLARCLHSAGHSAKAETEIKKVIAARPQWIDPHLDLAMYICSQGRFEESKSLLLKLQKTLPTMDPQQTVITFNLGWHLLRVGNFVEGMKALAFGRQLRVFGSHDRIYSKPKLFKGLPLKNKKVLLIGEAGAGDEIFNVRFAKTLQDAGAKATWVTGHQMDSLFSRAPGVEKVIRHSNVAAESYDYWAPSMDLASILELGPEELPASQYLYPDPRMVKKWQAKIPAKGKLKVGLRWQGNPLYEQDLFRSVPFSLLRSYLLIEDADFYSLQRDQGLEELLPADPVVDLSADLKTWEDTAAAISLLDVIVTSCTSIAHLAGALGKKTLLFTPMVCYYVWAPPGEKSIWYPDVHLFRQKKCHDWEFEAKEIGAMVKEWTKGKL